ncbi:MAG TPA: YibE/F family protein [bacterium]|nr:YibE/F family protein [bacterium]HPT29874.1 YibE/F family protein [bacterium]
MRNQISKPNNHGLNRFKKAGVIIALVVLLFPGLSWADEAKKDSTTFKARVVEVLQVVEKTRDDGTKFTQQDLKLLGLEGDWKDKEIVYHGVDDIEVANSLVYKIGDKVFVDSYADESGQVTFYVVDFVRSEYIYILFIIFVLAVLAIGRFKGFKALLSLVISFIVIIKFILPQILNGRDPFLVSLLGGLVILGVIIYLTEGFKRKSHIAVVSVLLSLFVTLVLSVVFTKLTKLSGLSQEEATFLIGMGGVEINFQGLLLAGFIIGAIGVLDDIIIGQIEAVEQIREANPALPPKRVFVLAYKVGNTHLGAIINTLFLTYAGAALPLLLLFIINQESGLTFNRLINTEVVSTEIVRTFVGSIGVILSMPIATFLASIKFKKKFKK